MSNEFKYVHISTNSIKHNQIKDLVSSIINVVLIHNWHRFHHVNHIFIIGEAICEIVSTRFSKSRFLNRIIVLTSSNNSRPVSISSCYSMIFGHVRAVWISEWEKADPKENAFSSRYYICLKNSWTKCFELDVWYMVFQQNGPQIFCL